MPLAVPTLAPPADAERAQVIGFQIKKKWQASAVCHFFLFFSGKKHSPMLRKAAMPPQAAHQAAASAGLGCQNLGAARKAACALRQAKLRLLSSLRSTAIMSVNPMSDEPP
jgi:hypothetical protein